jgi:hypothetical protein
MAKSSTYNQVTFRLQRAEASWREVQQLVREAAALPGYCGPEVGDIERVAEDIAQVRIQVRSGV